MTRPVFRATALFAAHISVLSCSPPAHTDAMSVRIASGPRDATFFILASALASLYSQRLPNLAAKALQTNGTSQNIDAVESGDAECGLGSADLVYNAHLRGTPRISEPHRHLRGVAVLFPNALHIVTRTDSNLRSLADLGGKRLAVAVPGDVTSAAAGPRRDAIVSAIAELTSRRVQPRSTLASIDDAVNQLGRRECDAADFYGGYPFRPVTDAGRRYGVRFIEFDERASSLVKSKYPFLRPITIPPGTYPGQESPVRTVAVDNVLVCRSDLPADIVYRLTATLFEGLPGLAAVHASARQVNPETGASTPIPLHEGAARYYRERELFR
jgi:TRAP transporter TAXI family solute receptor